MRGKDLLECMEYIDDALVQEAMEPTAVPHRVRCGNNLAVRWSMAAACVVMIGISAAAFWSHQNVMDKQMEIASDTSAPLTMDNAAAGDTGSSGSSSEGNMTAGAVAESTQADAFSEADSGNPVIRDLESDRDSAAVSQSTAADALSDAEEMVQEKEAAKPAYTIISDYYAEKDDSIYDYPVPEKGEFFCYHYLQKTMEYYAAMEDTADAAAPPVYAYNVVIDIYGDVEAEDGQGTRYGELNMPYHTNAGNEMIEQEYRRLTELGYSVRLSEDFQLTGTFTKEEIDTFQAFPEYGYTFRFENEY